MKTYQVFVDVLTEDDEIVVDSFVVNASSAKAAHKRARKIYKDNANDHFVWDISEGDVIDEV